MHIFIEKNISQKKFTIISHLVAALQIFEEFQHYDFSFQMRMTNIIGMHNSCYFGRTFSQLQQPNWDAEIVVDLLVSSTHLEQVWAATIMNHFAFLDTTLLGLQNQFWVVII